MCGGGTRRGEIEKRQWIFVQGGSNWGGAFRGLLILEGGIVDSSVTRVGRLFLGVSRGDDPKVLMLIVHPPRSPPPYPFSHHITHIISSATPNREYTKGLLQKSEAEREALTLCPPPFWNETVWSEAGTTPGERVR